MAKVISLNANPARSSPAEPLEPLADLRFRSLIGPEQWALLPAAVQKRFSKRLGYGASVVYSGEIVECEMNRAGWLLAQVCRLVGGPLPVSRDIEVPAAVIVTEDEATGGQFWTRLYGHNRGFPQVIHSSKRFAGETGLEEYLGAGVGIALTLSVEDGALHFHSDHYFIQILGRRLRIPRWLSPGDLTVSHVDCNDGCFAFVLDLTHPKFGPLIRQTGLFHDQKE